MIKSLYSIANTEAINIVVIIVMYYILYTSVCAILLYDRQLSKFIYIRFTTKM